MRLTILDYGSLELRLDILLPGDGNGEWIQIGVPGYLIQTESGENILVDTGMPKAYLDQPVEAAQNDGYDSWCRALCTHENSPEAQLAKVGLTPKDVTQVVVTHTHFDHAGGLNDFPDALLVIQHNERRLPAPLYKGFSWPESARWRIVDGDAELIEGAQLLSTPGHSPGHMSVSLALPQTGPVIIAIDAIYLPLSVEKDNFKAAADPEQARASGHRVAKLAEETGAWLLYGHDPMQWAELKKAPLFYE